MLQCPQCLTRYADGNERCPRDGSALQPVAAPGDFGPRWAPTLRGSQPGAGRAAPPVGPDPLIGQVLDDRLRVLRAIGQGGMGTVYVAEHVELGKQVAVKVLNPQVAGVPDVIRRLHSEARHAAAIRSAHIVDVFDVGTASDGRPFIVMELLDGESLAQRLARTSALSEADTLRIGRQLASALGAAHKSGIVHRDIKPENIFLCARDDGDFVKLLDFGIAKALGAGEVEGTRLTRTGAVLGTPLYMSPEQVRGEVLDHRVDIYALGVVLYECLTGSVPFCAPSYLAVVAKILTEEPEPPSLRSPERALSPALERIVLRAIAPDRDLRYPTMKALLADLDHYAAGEPLTDGEDEVAAPAPGGPQARLWRPILLGAALVLGVGLSASALLGPQVPPAARPEAGPTDARHLTPPAAEPATRPAEPLPAAAAPTPQAAVPSPAVAAPAPQAASPTVAVPSPTAVLDAAPASPVQDDLAAARRPPHPPGSPPAAAPAPGAPAPAAPASPAVIDPLIEEQAPNPFLPARGKRRVGEGDSPGNPR
jgi:serine/threonine-protein kinase